MNLKLKKEIIKHIYNNFGIFSKTQHYFNVFSNEFLLDKKIAFEDEEGKSVKNNIWGSFAKIDNNVIKIIIADTKDDIEEFTIIFQMDNLPPYALRLSLSEDDNGSIYFNPQEDKWIDANTAMQSKFLFGMECLNEVLLDWKKIENYSDLYKNLIAFLNFYEENACVVKI